MNLILYTAYCPLGLDSSDLNTHKIFKYFIAYFSFLSINVIGCNSKSNIIYYTHKLSPIWRILDGCTFLVAPKKKERIWSLNWKESGNAFLRVSKECIHFHREYFHFVLISDAGECSFLLEPSTYELSNG